MRNKKLLVYNDDGWSTLMRYPAPISIAELKKRTVGMVAGTGVDIYQMGLITGNVAIHRSKVLERYGSQLEYPDRMWIWRAVNTLKALEEQGTDILEVVTGACHELGIEAHASLRMNDKHHTYKKNTTFGGSDCNTKLPYRFRKHEYYFPDTRSNWIDEHKHLWLEDGSLNLAFEEVRQIRLDTIKELLDNYDIDGIDLDFTRFAPYLKEGEKEKNAHLITDLVKKAKKLVDEKSLSKGRKIKLTARVEFEPQVNLSEGLDVETWVKEGYLDTLYLGVIADATPDASAEPYVKICKGTGCKVCPSMEGIFSWVGTGTRIGPLRVPAIEVMRAVASKAYHEGSDGIQLFNFCCTDGEWNRQILDEISCPETIEFRDKQYVFTMGPWREFNMNCLWDSRVMLRSNEDEAAYEIRLGDDFEKANRFMLEPKGKLMMRIMGLNKIDDMEVTLNDNVLCFRNTGGNNWDWDGWSDIVYYDIPENAMKKGDNLLKIRRLINNEGYSGEIEVIEMELDIEYSKFKRIGAI